MRNAAIMLGVLLLALTAGCGGGSQVAGVPEGVTGAAPAAQADVDPEAQVDPQLAAELAAELERVLQLYPPREVSAPPSSSASATVLTFDDEAGAFQWRYYSAGDYDQNSEVGVSDLTPLGVHFGEQSGGGPFDPSTVESVVDGDSNGLIGVSDITPIGQNFGLVCDGYRLYFSTEQADVPQSAADANGAGTQMTADVSLSGATGTPAERKQFSYAPEETPPEGYYWVRPYDGEQLGTPSNRLKFESGEPVNLEPIAVVRAAPTSGLVPLTVEFLALFSADLDGEIVRYEWDFDGPVGGEDWLDTGDEAFAVHTYEAGGDYLATLRVTDDQGATGTTDELIRAREPTPPSAELDYMQESTATPSHVHYDAGASTDPDGVIVRYEWDFDLDGDYEYDSGAESSTDFYYWEPRMYYAMVRVTDDDGLSDENGVAVEVTAGQQWHISTILTSTSNEDENTGGGLGRLSPVAEIDGRPAATYRVGLPEDMDVPTAGHDARLEYVIAQDDRGATWQAPVVLDPGNIPGIDYHPKYSMLGLIEGKPAVAYSWSMNVPEDPQHGVGNVKFLRSSDAVGEEWPTAQELEQANAVSSQLMIADGNPAFFDGHYLQRAGDTVGTSWPHEYDVGPPYTGTSTCFEIVENHPAYACYSGTAASLIYRRALNDQGSAWPALPVVIEERVGSDLEMVIAAGHPEVAYFDSVLNRIMYTRALDPLGAEWETPRVVAIWTRGKQSMTLFDGRPVMLYGDDFTEETMFIAANDAAGTSWGFPMVIDVIDDVEDAIDTAYESTLVPIAGAPAFAYVYYLSEGPVRDGYIRYVTYY